MADRFNEFPDETNLRATGFSGKATDLTTPQKLFLFKEGVEHATVVVAKTESVFDALIQSEDIIPIPLIFNAEPMDTEESIDEGNTGQKHKTSDGVGGVDLKILTSAQMHSRLRSYDQYQGGYMIVDKNNNCLMYTPDGTKVAPLTIGMCSVGLHTKAIGDVSSYTPIKISDKYPEEYNNTPAVFKPSWNILGKNGLLPVTLEVSGTPSSTEIIVKAEVTETGAAVSGLETATDWVLLSAAGVANAVTAAESGTIPGQYTLTGTTIVTGTLTLGLPSVMSVDGYKSDGSIAITIA